MHVWYADLMDYELLNDGKTSTYMKGYKATGGV